MLHFCCWVIKFRFIFDNFYTLFGTALQLSMKIKIFSSKIILNPFLLRGHQKHNDIKYRVQLEKYKISFVKQIFVINRSNYQQISNESLGCLFINYQSTAVLITLFLYTCLFMIYNFAFFYLNSFEQLFIFFRYDVSIFESLVAKQGNCKKTYCRKTEGF